MSQSVRSGEPHGEPGRTSDDLGVERPGSGEGGGALPQSIAFPDAPESRYAQGKAVVTHYSEHRSRAKSSRAKPGSRDEALRQPRSGKGPS